ncbi:MAG: hypothetical protein EBV34_10935 [Betaproteobacteria bacterium]|nr:hypothetical protein [Betaproteobacteria bacterium]
MQGNAQGVPMSVESFREPVPGEAQFAWRKRMLGWFVAFVGALFGFVVIGYAISDVRFADQLIAQHRITSPDAVFDYVIGQKVQAPPGSPVFYGQSFQRMMGTEKNWLWCDEGAIAIAVMARRLGYRTRLVDLLHRDTGISHHTIVEVYVDNAWRAYDFTGRRKVTNPTDSVDYPSRAHARAYPQLRHDILLYNGVLRFASERWRARNWPAPRDGPAPASVTSKP